MKHGSLRPATDVRAALRAATETLHLRMHGLEPFAAIAGGTLTADRYPRLLQSLLLFHSTIGAAADRHGWSALRGGAARTDLLRNDLRQLGGGARPPLVDWQPASPHEALGALYAAEGSMLGGRVIATQLDYLFGDSADGRSFFIGAPEDASRWRTLLAALEEHCATPIARGHATSGALAAFRLFEQCVTGGTGDEGLGCSCMSVARTFAQGREARAWLPAG